MLVLLAVFMLLGARSADVTLTVSPAVAFAPATLRLTLLITPHPDNRAVCLEYDGGEYSRSCWDLTAESPRQTVVRRYVGTAGEYEAVATVYRTDEHGRQSSTAAHVRFQLLGEA